ncbi:MAG: DUF2283 domain-containing protein [Rubrobacter sp.]
MRFAYYPDVDALYIHLNPGREPNTEGGDTVVIGDGCVVDVDAEGVPIGIEIHQEASKVVDLSRLEAEGPIFGIGPSEGPKRRVS